MKSKKKRIILIMLGVVLALLLICAIVIWVMFGNQIMAAMSVETLEEDFYSMEYKGDYGFDAMLENGGVSNDEELINHIVDKLYHNICDVLKQYDMHASMGGQFKFAITDASGKTVNIEYIMNEMYVTEVDAISNFVQTPGSNYGLGLSGKCPRYEKMMEAYQEYNGKMTEEMMMDTMESVSDVVANTQWTVVFNTKELTATYCYYGAYEKKYSFSIK